MKSTKVIQVEDELITVDGRVFIPKDLTTVSPLSATELQWNSEVWVRRTPKVDGLPLVLIRGYGSGVQFGYLAEQNGCQVKLLNSRRIWSWNKATECSQIAVDGIDASSSKVTVEVSEKTITDAIEIITITAKAAANLTSQPIWSK